MNKREGKRIRPPAIVAELGRPETAEEKAARHAESSQNHRKHRTVNNLLYSLLVTLGVVFVIVLIVPHSENLIEINIDYAAVATKAQSGISETLAVPRLPENWRSNVAELRTNPSDGIQTWFIGFLTPGNQFIGMAQGLDANPTWVSDQVNKSVPTGAVSIDGTDWIVYDNRSSTADVGNVRYALNTQAGHSNYVLYGTATTDEFTTLAQSLQPTLTTNQNAAGKT